MSERNAAMHTVEERGHAVERLKAAVSQQSRLRKEHQAAKDTTGDLTAGVSLRSADEQVAARERWLKSVDDHDY
jgi:hypothetical protein